MRDIEERLYEAFGVDRGGKDPEAADPEERKEEVQEETGAAGTEPEEESGAADTDDTDPDEDPEDGEQSRDQRRENAKRRRQQETQAAIDAAVQKALADRDQAQAEQEKLFFEQAGIVNPYTKKPITNMQEFREWRAEHENQTLQNNLRSGKLTNEDLDRIVDRRIAERERAEQEAREQRENQAAMDAEVERQLAKIREKDPAVKKTADLINRPYATKLYEYVKRGNNLEDAFYLATRGMEEDAIAKAARQSAETKASGKEHLRTTDIGGKPGATVTTDEMKMYRLFNPKATAEEIQRYQNKYKQGG